MQILFIDYIDFIPIVFLYAELHYYFKFTGSLYYLDEPEILTDAPSFIEPNRKLPILLFIKDAHKYKLYLKSYKVIIYKNKNIIFEDIININRNINEHFWSKIELINLNNIFGKVTIQVFFDYDIDNIKKQCITHNIPQSKKHYLDTIVMKEAYPRGNNVIYGDLHYHSSLTEDMVEYGAPLKETLIMAESMGLDFYCNTDHSYDLDDQIGSWTETDPELVKWKQSRKEIKNINKISNSFIIPSEELSLQNYKGQNIHALILNNNTFIPGSGDGAEKIFNIKSEYNTNNVFKELEKNAICIAAHPFVSVSFLEKLFLNRGKWHKKDLANKNLLGLQIVNGKMDNDYFKSYRQWISLLLDGYKKFIYAGNDAHGNFNIYRQIKIPMISIKEKKEQIFGVYRTGVILNNKSNVLSAISSLKSGNCFVTNGPYINMTILNNNKTYNMGSTILSKNASININIISNSHFGKIKQLIIYQGDYKKKREYKRVILLNIDKYNFEYIYEYNISCNCYFRSFIMTETVHSKSFAISNPIWLEIS